MKADFNTLNKIVFNNRALPVMKASKIILSEVIGGWKGQFYIHVALNKKLVCDIRN